MLRCDCFSVPAIIPVVIRKRFVSVSSQGAVYWNVTLQWMVCEKLLGAPKAPVQEKSRPYWAWWKGSWGLPLIQITPRFAAGCTSVTVTESGGRERLLWSEVRQDLCYLTSRVWGYLTCAVILDFLHFCSSHQWRCVFGDRNHSGLNKKEAADSFTVLFNCCYSLLAMLLFQKYFCGQWHSGNHNLSV